MFETSMIILDKLNFNFAGPGRQPGYFLFKAKKKVTKEMA
jgi:hypothetical protein